MDRSVCTELAENWEERCFLDCFPAEVRERIAEYVCGGRVNLDALSLAEVSEFQRAAVLSATRHTFYIGELCSVYGFKRGVSEPSTVDRWLKLALGDIQKVNIASNAQAYDENVIELLKSKNLTTVAVPERAPVLNALREGCSVQDLTVSLIETDHELLLKTLGDLNLTRLAILCNRSGLTSCVTQLVQNNGGIEAISLRCPNLIALRLVCYCAGEITIWPALKQMKSLRELDVAPRVPDDALPFLRQLEKVRIGATCADGARLASKIGTNVVTLTHLESWMLREDTFASLGNCSRLSSLSMRISPKHNSSLASVLPKFPNLCGLALHWEVPPVGVHKPPRNFILNMLRSMSSTITALYLMYVRIDKTELREILRHFGPHLRRCGFSIRSQGEPKYMRLNRIMRCLAVYTTSLQEMFIAKTDVSNRLRTTEEEKTRRLLILNRSKRLLLRSAPTLDEQRLQLSIADVVEWM